MNYFFIDPWHDFLPREPGHVVAFMGSGGKTSLMRIVARALAAEGVPVIMTTTTRSEPLTDVTGLRFESAGSLPDDPLVYLHAGPDEQGKWRGLPADTVDELSEVHPGRIVLVEVDGAAGLPLKIHREGEPVWPGRTSLAVIVMGAGAVGCKTEDVVHRFGRRNSPALDGQEPWSILEWDHAAAMLLEEGGYLAQVPDQVPAVLALAGLGGQADSIGLFAFADRAMGDPRLPVVMFCETNTDPPSLRTACREEEGDGA